MRYNGKSVRRRYYLRHVSPVPARTCHRIPVKRHRQWEKNKLPESDDQSPWRQSAEPSITRDLVASSSLLSERSAHSLPVPVSLANGSPSGRRVPSPSLAFVEAMYRAQEKTIVSFVRLDALYFNGAVS